MASKNITLFKPYESRSPSGSEKGYLRVTNSLYDSDAVKDLSDLAFRVYIDMRFVAKGHETVIYTQSMGMKRIKLSKGGYTNSIKQLVEVGYLIRLPRGCYSPSTYKFSPKWHKYKSKQRDALTGEYIKKSRLNNSPLKSTI